MQLFKKLRLRSHVRLFLIFILTFIIPLSILTVVFLQSYRSIYSREAEQAACREMDSVATTINTQCQIAATYLAQISQDETLRDYLKIASKAEYDDLKASFGLNNVILRYATGTPTHINPQVIVVTSNHKILYGNHHLKSLPNPDEFFKAVQDSYRSPLKATTWCSYQYISGSSMNDSYIYVTRAVTDSSDWSVIGYVLLRFRVSDLVSMYLYCADEHRSVFVLDASGNIISAIDNLNVGSSIIEPRSWQIVLNNEPIYVGKSMVYTNKLSNLWYLVSVTQTQARSQPTLSATMTLYVVALLLCVVLTLGVSYVMSRRFMRPVNLLIARMQEVEQGNLHSLAIINTHDEFEELANNYNKMIARVEDLMRQIIYKEEQKRVSDIRMLQAQINPHFLYNTLASIRYMIYTNPPEDIDTMLLALSRFLKYVLSNADNVYVTLDREFEQMENYITIQQFGFEVPLQYKVDIEAGLGQCLAVKMLFQPLIENAILHGLKLNKENPRL